MSSQSLRLFILSILIVLLCTACAAQGSTGLIGLSLSSSLLTLFLLLAGGSQSGCDIGPCLSLPYEGPAGETAGEIAGEIAGDEVGPCLQPPSGVEAGGYDDPSGYEVGPCLSPPLAGDEYGPAGMDVGPCLSPPIAGDDVVIPEMGAPDVSMSDVGVSDMSMSDMGPPDMSVSDMSTSDMLMPEEIDAGEINPCLSAPISDMGMREIPNPEPDQKRMRRQRPDRAQVIEKISGRNALPADVLERIKRK